MATENQTVKQASGLITALWAKPRVRTLAQYLAALALCLLVLGTVLNVRREARKWPYLYQGDTMFYHLTAKSVIDHGWFLDVPLLGAPGQLNLRDVPTSDNNLHILLLRLLALNTSHYPSVLNNFFLLSFPLVFLCALWVLRHFGVTWWASVWASLLYTFTPYHLTRNEHHIFLSAYWTVPLVALMVLWVSRGELWPEQAERSRWRYWRLGLSVLICLVLGATGFYYAFFACFFLLVAGVLAVVQRRDRRGGWLALGLIAVIVAAVVVNLLPSILYFSEHGNVQIVRRQAGEADYYGLRIAQLLLPVRWHRLRALEDLKTEYNQRLFINENDDASLGFVGALAFLGLLWWFCFRKPAVEKMNEGGAAGLLHHLSIFNLAGLLFGTMGGFGSLVAFFGLSQVRAYNRISIFLAFFVLFALALWVEGWARRSAVTRARQVAMGVALVVLTVLALYDQISPKTLPEYEKVKAQFINDGTFVREIEKNVPHGAMIFQLPVMSFPENPPVARMKDYDLLRGYLHSSHLRWSYGTIKGREGDIWLRQVASQPLDEMVETLAWAGFSGIYIDRNGYADNAVRLEKELYNALCDYQFFSPDEKLIFYNLKNYRERLLQRTPQSEWEAKREAALHPMLAVWQSGFSELEGPADDNWRWCGAQGRMALINRTARPQQVRLEMTVAADYGGNVTIQAPFFNEQLKADKNGQKVNKTFDLPPGEHAVYFASDARRVYPANDFRELVFRVRNFKLTPLAVATEQKKTELAVPVVQSTPAVQKTKAAKAGR